MHRNVLFLLVFILALGTGCSKSAKLARHLNRAEAAWQKGDFETARLEYLNVLQTSRDHPDALSRLGVLLFDRGEIISAAQLLARAKEIQPTNITVRLKLGAIFTAIGKHTNAVQEADYVLSQDPNNTEAAVLLANSTPRTDLAGLETRLRSMLATRSDSTELHLALGVLNSRLGKDAEAQRSFERAHSLNPKHSKPAFALGNLFWSQNKTNEAASFLKMAADLAPLRSYEHLRYVEFLVRNGQSSDGRKMLEETVVKVPDFIPARISLAEIHLMEHRTNECSAQIEAVFKRDPQNIPALSLRSKLKQALGDSAGAIEDLEQVVQLDKGNTSAHYELAQLYRSRNDFSRAFVAVDRAIASRTNFLQGILLKSELLIASGDNTAAIPPLIRLTNQVPKNPAPYFLLASALRSRGTPEDALAVYRQMTQIFPADPQPHYFAGITFRQQRRYADARQAYTRALQVQTNFLPAIDDLIELDLMATNYSGALQRVQTYVDLYPDKPMPRLLQAKVFIAEKKYADAEASLKKAIELSPEFYLAHRALATLYITSQQTTQAIDKLKSLVEKNPKDTGSLLQLGMLFESEKSYDAARKAYQELLVVQPNSVYALNNLAYLLSEHFQDNDAAWTTAQKARALNANDPFLADTYGWIAFRRGDYTRAISVLQFAADRLSDKPEVSFHLGMAYYMSAQKDQAAAALGAAAASSTEFTGKDQAKSALAVLNIAATNATPSEKKLIADALARNPADVFALIRQAQIYQSQKDWAQARASYESALKASPRSVAILLELASLKIEHLNQKAEGLAHAREAWGLAQDPATAAVVGRLGVLAGASDWALPILQTARNAATDPVVHFYHALAAYSHADFAAATDSLERVRTTASAFPEKAAASDFLTIVNIHLGRIPPAAAAPAIAALLKYDSQFAPAFIGEGLVLESNSKFGEARQQYESVLKLDPGHVLAQRQLAVLLSDKLSDDNAAVSLASRVRSQIRDDPVAAAVLGKVAYRRGDHREAVSLLTTAKSRLPQNADILYHLGLAEFHLKQKNARRSLTEALSLDPGAKLAADARKALAELN